MVRLVAGSDALRRALLDLHHRVAARLAGELTGYAAPQATVLADALLAVVVRATERLGTAPDHAALPGIAEDAHAALDALQVLAEPVIVRRVRRRPDTAGGAPNG